MRRVTRRPFLKRLRSGERGAVATIVAVLACFGVVTGMLALTVDVGNVWWERRQLQNGADATSLGLAAYCAQKGADCDPAKVAYLLSANATDNAAQYDLRPGQASNGACGRAVVGAPATLDQCPSATTDAALTDLSKCPPLPDWLKGAGATIPYVETYSKTEQPDGQTILPKFFSQALLGGPGPDVTVTACARAAWGPPSSYTGAVPVTFSACEWNNFMTATGSVYPNLPVGFPGYGGAGQPAWPDSSYERVIYFKDASHTAPCTNSNGKDGPGGFGNVQLSGGVCEATVSTGGWLIGEQGNSMTNPCKDVLAALRGTVVNIPVFDCLYISNTAYNGTVAAAPTCNGGSGGTYNYHIVGWAKFYISGYVFPSMRQASYITGSNPCSNSETCLSGWFVKGELQATGIAPPGGAGDFGSYAVLPAG